MVNTDSLINRIYERIEQLKEKNILVEVKMPIDEKHKFSTYSTHELNSVSYKVI